MFSVSNVDSPPCELSSDCSYSINVTSGGTNKKLDNFMRFIVSLTTASSGLRAFRRPEKPDKLEPARLGF